jgi:hypothetical protein
MTSDEEKLILQWQQDALRAEACVEELDMKLQTTQKLIKAYEEYVALLEESEASLAGIAMIHGCTVPADLVKRGEELRHQIKQLKMQLNNQEGTEHNTDCTLFVVVPEDVGKCWIFTNHESALAHKRKLPKPQHAHLFGVVPDCEEKNE